MKDKKGFLSPLFLKYQSEYEKNPNSRVFAPLADLYRKVGMTDRAMEILANGIRNHPTYVLGHVGMANCYFDIQQFSLAYTTLKPFIEVDRDNIKLQRLYAETCLRLDKKEEALNTFKYLLFMVPKDKEIAEYVKKLEDDLHNLYKPIHNPIKLADSNILNNQRNTQSITSNPTSVIFDPDSWTQLSMNNNHSILESEDPLSWEMQKNNSVYSQEIHKIEAEPEKREFKIVLDLEKPIQVEEKVQVVKSVNAAPIITHTLVDLYIGQGYLEKALELLEKILLLNPDDLKTKEKLNEIKMLLITTSTSDGSKLKDVKSDSDSSSENRIIEVSGFEQLLSPAENANMTLSDSKSTKKYDLSLVESEDEGRKVLMDEISLVNVDKFLDQEDQENLKLKTALEISKKKEKLLLAFLTEVRKKSEKLKSI